MESIPGVVYRRGPAPSWTFGYVSDAVESITGHRASEVTRSGTATDALTPVPEDLAAVTDAIRIATSARRAFDLEYRVRHRDGTLRWVHDRGQPGRDTTDAVGWIDGVIFDVTERKLAEARLEQQRARLLALMETSPDYIYFKDADSRFTMISMALARSFGLGASADAVGRTDLARQALVAGMSYFAVKRNVRLIAEGVETQAELGVLRSLGISYGQGYLLGRPRDGRGPGPWPSAIAIKQRATRS